MGQREGAIRAFGDRKQESLFALRKARKGMQARLYLHTLDQRGWAEVAQKHRTTGCLQRLEARGRPVLVGVQEIEEIGKRRNVTRHRKRLAYGRWQGEIPHQ